jgi:hypothetical protein
MKTIKLPNDLYQRASGMDEREHISVEKMVAALVTEGVGQWTRVQSLASRGSMTITGPSSRDWGSRFSIRCSAKWSRIGSLVRITSISYRTSKGFS